MSIEAINKVWKTSNRKSTDLLVLLAIADYAQDSGINAFPSYDRLGKKARLTRRGAMKAVTRLKTSGELVIHVEQGARTRMNRHTNSFDIVYQDGSNWAIISQRCQSYGTPLPQPPKGVYNWGNGEPQDTIKKSNSEPPFTINSEPQDTINGEPPFTHIPSIDTSIETTITTDANSQTENLTNAGHVNHHPQKTGKLPSMNYPQDEYGDFPPRANGYAEATEHWRSKFGAINGFTCDLLDDLLSGQFGVAAKTSTFAERFPHLVGQSLSLDRLKTAIDIMAVSNERRPKYLLGILENQIRDGTTGYQAKKQDEVIRL